MKRIYLSPPDLSPLDRELVLDALESGWAAPVGPHVDAFEREVAAVAEVPHAVALSSGTAALHLSLAVLGVGPGDEVLTSTLDVRRDRQRDRLCRRDAGLHRRVAGDLDDRSRPARRGIDGARRVPAAGRRR